MTDARIPAEEPDPTKNWDDRRKAYEQKRAAENERGAWLLANYYRPSPPVVRGGTASTGVRVAAEICRVI